MNKEGQLLEGMPKEYYDDVCYFFFFFFKEYYDDACYFIYLFIFSTFDLLVCINKCVFKFSISGSLLN